MLEFNLFKIPVRIEPSFWIIIGLLGILSNQGNPSEMLVNAGLFTFVAFISILIHEMGHALMIKKYGLPTQVVLASFGGFASYPAGILSRLQSFLVTLAGPLLQASVGYLVYFLVVNNYVDIPNNKMSLMVMYFYVISIFWAVFNCVPVLPLDGGRMLEAVLGPKRIKLTLLISIITAAVVGVVGFMYGQPFIGIFMLMFGWQNYQAYERFK